MAGITLGYTFIKKSPKNASSAMVLLLLAIPITSYVEKDSELPLREQIKVFEWFRILGNYGATKSSIKSMKGF